MARGSLPARAVGLFVAAGCLVTPAFGNELDPVPVSPGRGDGGGGLAARCPTFHWAAATGARAVELLVFEVGQGIAGERGEPRAVLRVSLPGAAAGFTAPPGGCLTHGGAYAWMLRAHREDGTGEWTGPSFFSVPAEPTHQEVADARDVLRRHSARVDDSRRESSGPAPLPAGPPARPHEAAADGARSTPRASVAHERRQSVIRANAAPDGVVRAAAAATAPSPSEDASLSVTDNLRLAAGSNVFKAGSVFLWDDGDNNIALGRNALGSNTTNGENSTAIGSNALASNLGAEGDDGSNNTAVGNHALFKNDIGFDNTAVGDRALFENLGGYNNTGVGAYALHHNTGGLDNTAMGLDALRGNTGGGQNSAFGVGTLQANVGGNSNTAAGFHAALGNTHGSDNLALGVYALANNSIGSRNVAVGKGALRQLNPNGSYGEGNDNIALGYKAGYAINELAGSFNIHIGHQGQASDSNLIRIGSSQTATYVAGIYAQSVFNPAYAHPVWIDDSGKLGLQPVSSRRFKEDIRDLGQDSRAILDLRPVAFRYKPRDAGPRIADGGRSPLQTGLIAEEVAEVMPSLVRRDADGEPLGVDYHELIPLLLNELQRQERELAALREEVARLQPRSARKSRGDAAPPARRTRAPARR